MKKWFWTAPLPGTSLWPHHRRWDCRKAIVEALRSLDDPADCEYWIGRAEAFNAIMYDCGDPMAWRYGERIRKARALARNPPAEPADPLPEVLP